MDLRGTHHIVLMNIPFTEAKHEQIIGRGQRFRSHPPDSTVHVWRVFLARQQEPDRPAVEERIFRDLILQKLIKGAQGQPHVTIQGGGHFLQEDKPEACAEVVLRVVASVGGRARL